MRVRAPSKDAYTRLVHAGDELVLDDGAVALPVLAVLERAALEVAAAAVDEDGDEEDGVEVRDRGARALAEAPREAHHPVRDVVLARAGSAEEEIRGSGRGWERGADVRACASRPTSRR